MIELRPYQLDVIGRTGARIAEGARRVLIQAPTGAGKTHISSEIIRRGLAKGRRWLFLAHRRRLISQKSERLDQFGVPHGVIMAGHPRDNSALVQVASRDTLLSRVVRNDWVSPPPADGVIVDEAHNCLSEEYQRLLEIYRGSVIIGLTATPARSDGRGLGSYYQALECTCPTSQLVREGFLVPIKCYAPSRQGGKRGGTKLAGDPVQHWLRLANGRPTVLFAARRAESRAACAAFRAAGITAEHIDQHTDDDERDRVAEAMATGEVKVCCNVGLWTEGVDIPCLSCCILLRMAGSYVLFAQAVGRVMRAHASKTDAILIDHAGAVYVHGFPDEDVEWTLEEDDTVDGRVKKAKDAGARKAPICCPKCACMFSGSVACPGCGHKLPMRMQPPSLRQEILEEADRRKDPVVRREEQIRFWRHCLFVMAHKGRTAGAASWMYRGRWNAWPEWDFPDIPSGGKWNVPVTQLFPHYAPKVSA